MSEARYAFPDGSFVIYSSTPSSAIASRIEAKSGRVVPKGELLRADVINDHTGRPKRAWLDKFERWQKPSEARRKGAAQ